MKLRILSLLILLSSLSCSVMGVAFSPDTLRFRFSLYGQTRVFDMKFEPRADSLLIHWQIGRHGIVYGGGYGVGPRSLAGGSRLCFRQPEPGTVIGVPAGETAFTISRKALKCLRDSAYFVYGNTRYGLADSAECAPGVPSLHVVDSVEGCQMWIIDDMRLPLIWRMEGNPLCIDWTVDNAAEAFMAAGGGVRVAFIADAHVQDVESRPALVRTLRSEMMSTRLFNENIYAFRAALNDVARRGIRLVALPGDLTDNGQSVNVRAVRRILDEYAGRYGMMFFVTTGNHDPYRPEGYDYEESDFLGADGSAYPVASAAGVAGAGVPVDTTLHCLGYRELMDEWAGFGYSPRPEYLYWATPFSTYGYDGYSLDLAREAAIPSRRTYPVPCGQGDTLRAIDASYVVEPREGLWLLAIDGGVYAPEGMSGGRMAYGGASAGYAGVEECKGYLVEWIGRVAAEARRRGKTLVAFCHYPAADFHNGAAPLIASWLGGKAMNMHRRAPGRITDALLKAGVRLHFAGHLHQNNTAVVTDGQGHRMYNVQVPSVSAYIPAYKILTLGDDGGFGLETVVLDSVGGFRSAWPSYVKEYARSRAVGKPAWNADILYSADYPTFCDMHFRGLVEQRYMPAEMPRVVRDSIAGMTGGEIMALATGGEACGGTGGDTLAWTGLDLVTDMYRLHFAGELALRNIPQARLRQYRALIAALEAHGGQGAALDGLRNLAMLLKAFMNFVPDAAVK